LAFFVGQVEQKLILQPGSIHFRAVGFRTGAACGFDQD
jgi:hypothetical protein